MEFQIRKNVPMPTAKGRGPRTSYPFLQMEIGDSIFVPGMTTKQMTGQLGFWKKTHGLNFAIAAGSEDRLNTEGETVSVEGVTVWIKDPAEKSNRGRRAAVAAPAPFAPAPFAPAPVAPAPVADADAPADGDAPAAETKKGKSKVKVEAPESEY